MKRDKQEIKKIQNYATRIITDRHVDSKDIVDSHRDDQRRGGAEIKTEFPRLLFTKV